MLHDDSWFNGSDPRDEDLGTFAIKTGHKDKPADPLRPFHKDASGDYWTSSDVKETTALGYTYPDLEKWRYTNSDGSYNKQKHINDLTRKLNSMYNGDWSATQKSKLTADPGQSDGPRLMSLRALQTTTQKEPVDLKVHDYVVNVIYEK